MIQNIQIGQQVFVENSFWSVQATVSKVSDKAVELTTTDNEQRRPRRAWFPKAALTWRDGEEGETAQLAKWFRKNDYQQRFFDEC